MELIDVKGFFSPRAQNRTEIVHSLQYMNDRKPRCSDKIGSFAPRHGLPAAIRTPCTNTHTYTYSKIVSFHKPPDHAKDKSCRNGDGERTRNWWVLMVLPYIRELSGTHRPTMKRQRPLGEPVTRYHKITEGFEEIFPFLRNSLARNSGMRQTLRRKNNKNSRKRLKRT